MIGIASSCRIRLTWCASTLSGSAFADGICCVTHFAERAQPWSKRRSPAFAAWAAMHILWHRVSRVKANWSLDVDLLSSLLRRILTGAEEQMIRHDLPPLSFYTLLVRETNSGQKNGYRSSEDEEKLLPTGFLSERPLQRLLILRDEIEESTEEHPQEIRDFFLLGMSHVIANGAGNFAFGTGNLSHEAQARLRRS